MKLRIELAVALGLLTAAGAAGPCRAGSSLSQSDIVTWNLSVTDPNLYPGGSSATTISLVGPGSGDNSLVGLVGADLTATSTELLFNFSGTDHGYLLFQTPPLVNGADFWCSASAAYPTSCSDQTVAGEAVAVHGPTNWTLLSGTLVIASGGKPDGVGSDIVYNVDQSWMANGQTFSVTGTITTDGARTTAVPEPGMLSLLLSGMLALGGVTARRKRLSQPG